MDLDSVLDDLLTRLNADMTSMQVEIWFAEALDALTATGHLHKLSDALEKVEHAEMSLEERLATARDILHAAQRILSSQIGISGNSGQPGTTYLSPATGGTTINIFSPAQQQWQGIVQPLTRTWEEIEEIIDSDDRIGTEHKEEAKGAARQMWELVSSGSRDILALYAAFEAFARLGGDAKELIQYLRNVF